MNISQRILQQEGLKFEVRNYIFNKGRFWDTLDSSKEKEVLFGSANIGTSLTNLQVVGDLPATCHFLVTGWDANKYADGIVELIVNDKPKATCLVEDLYRFPREILVVLKKTDDFRVVYRSFNDNNSGLVRISLEGWQLHEV